MLAAQAQVFGLSITELAILVAALGYLVSLIKDWRPIKTLRAENEDLRASLKSANVRIDELEQEVRELGKSAVPVIRDELVEVARILARVSERLEALDGSVKASTAAVEVLSKRKIIDEALEEGGVTP